MTKQPKYIMVKEQIKEWITNGKVTPGERIYSENQLVKFFSVSRQTIRQAIGELVHEGWLYREKGAGTFCSNRAVQSQTFQNQPIKKLSNTNGKNIGVITTHISEYIFPSIIKGIESYLTEQGYSLTLMCTDNNLEKEKQCLQSMLNRNIDGLITESTRGSSYNPNIPYYLELEQNNIPYLMINAYYPQLSPPRIIVDDYKGGYLATEHLIKMGHKKIIGIFKTDDMQGGHRMQGFIQAIRENNPIFFPDMIITYSTGEKNTLLLEKVRNSLSVYGIMPTGIVCYNDEVATSVINVLRELELRVPEDISIVGFDDSHLAQTPDIKLTSITHPKTEMGIEAAKWIISTIEKNGSDVIKHSTVYEPELVIRNSTAPIKRNS